MSKRPHRFLYPSLAAVALVVLLAFTLFVTTRDDTTNTETGLWTFILFAIGLAVSYYLGRRSIHEAAQELVRPQARGAARRLTALGKSLAALQRTMNAHRAAWEVDAPNADDAIPMSQINLAYESFSIQLDTAGGIIVDSLMDWREFDSTIVADLNHREDPAGAQ
ncbi:MAG TPA: hypothetical protein VGO48_14790 [Conexibacter sp.]|nr:hypothetical protein [Conexibacter sp.]